MPGTGLALNVSPQSAHRHAVSAVICFASVPTRVDPQDGQVGLVGSSFDMKSPGLGNYANEGKHTTTEPKRIMRPFSRCVDPVAAGAFRTVHRLISPVRKLLRINTHRFCRIECGNADRNGYGLGVRAASPPEMSGETFSRMAGSSPWRVRHQHRELIASPPCSQISFTKGCVDGIGNATYDAITGSVASVVVDPLESIDIEKQQRHWRTVPLCAVKIIGQASSQGSPVRQTRQGIRLGKRFQAVSLTTNQVSQRTEQDG